MSVGRALTANCSRDTVRIFCTFQHCARTPPDSLALSLPLDFLLRGGSLTDYTPSANHFHQHCLGPSSRGLALSAENFFPTLFALSSSRSSFCTASAKIFLSIPFSHQRPMSSACACTPSGSLSQSTLSVSQRTVSLRHAVRGPKFFFRLGPKVRHYQFHA